MTRSELASPSIVTCGYAVADVSLDDAVVSAGGTALNVADALSAFGWQSSLVGYLGDDPAGNLIKTSLASANVNVSHLELDARWTTPVVLQKSIHGHPSWSFSCPHCGAQFAKHRPAPASEAKNVLAAVAPPTVFFFDRATLFALALAEAWRQAGTLIFFEPSGLGRPQLFDRAVGLSHFVKFSSERAAAFEANLELAESVQIRTKGAAGLDFKVGGRWHYQAALAAPIATDSAGAGDWTTAGFLNSLLRGQTSEAMMERTEATLTRPLADGQRFGALACAWTGARPRTWPSVTGHRVVDYRFFCPRMIRP